MPNISSQEQSRRQHDADRIRHSTAMEGGSTSQAVRELQDQYIRGEVTDPEYDELVSEHLRRLREGFAN